MQKLELAESESDQQLESNELLRVKKASGIESVRLAKLIKISLLKVDNKHDAAIPDRLYCSKPYRTS